MTFEELKDFVNSIDTPSQRLGIFDLTIYYRRKWYIFVNLKLNAGNNPELLGFGLNHHFDNIKDLPSKSSIFHDSEDVCIDIWKDLFVSAEKKRDYAYRIKTKKWSGILTINY